MAANKLPVSRLPIVGVMGSGKEDHIELAAPLGRLLARMGVHLLTGGGGGVMTAVARAFVETLERKGLAIGVLPAGRDGYPNPWVEIPIATHLPLSGEHGEEPLSRNHINVLSSAAIVALPGGGGTLSETRLARRYAKPLTAWGWAPPGCAESKTLEDVEAFLRSSLAGSLRSGPSSPAPPR